MINCAALKYVRGFRVADRDGRLERPLRDRKDDGLIFKSIGVLRAPKKQFHLFSAACQLIGKKRGGHRTSALVSKRPDDQYGG